MFVGGLTKSEFIIYRLLVARSKAMWGENVHKFHQVAGIMVVVFGILLALGVIPMRQKHTEQNVGAATSETAPLRDPASEAAQR